MTPDEFWYGDPELYYNYCRVYEIKFKQKEQAIWEMGARMCQALQSTPIVPVGVVDGKSIKSMPNFPDCPYMDDKTEDELSEDELEYLRERARVNFTNWVNSFKRK